jgi:hypothetical protein
MIIPFATSPTLALRSSQSSVQWVRWALSVGLQGTRTLERVGRSARKENILLVNYYAASHADPHETLVGQFRHGFSGANPFQSGRPVRLTPQWRYHIAWRDKKGRMIQPALLGLSSRFDSRWATNSNRRRSVVLVQHYQELYNFRNPNYSNKNGGKIFGKKLGN